MSRIYDFQLPGACFWAKNYLLKLSIDIPSGKRTMAPVSSYYRLQYDWDAYKL